MSEPSFMCVWVVASFGPRQVEQESLQLVSGACVQDALDVSSLLARWQAQVPDAGSVVVGLWGRKVAMNVRLHEGDRIELYRRLEVDPKLARRARFQKQGTRSAGLFAKNRPGAKSGY